MQCYQPPPDGSPVPQGTRTAIPLRSILNVDAERELDEREAAAPVQFKTEPSASEGEVSGSVPAKRSQFLFVNSHNAARPGARLREDQKIINAHVQHASHRQRRAAAIGRLKLSVRLCSGCAAPGPLARMQFADNSPSEGPSPLSSSSEGPSPTSSYENIVARRNPLRRGADGQRSCSKCGGELDNGAGSRSVTDIETRPRNINTSSKYDSPQSHLHPSQQPNSIFDASVIDPFGTGSVSLTMHMNGVLQHCK